MKTTTIQRKIQEINEILQLVQQVNIENSQGKLSIIGI